MSLRPGLTAKSRLQGKADKRSYFEGGISSVYLWDVDEGFAGCVLLKKCMRVAKALLHQSC